VDGETAASRVRRGGAQSWTPAHRRKARTAGKRLKALIPLLVDAMERHRQLDLDPIIKTNDLQGQRSAPSIGNWPLWSYLAGGVGGAYLEARSVVTDP